jgi:hypothetical protein
MVIQAGILCKWTNDSQRFLLEHIDTIHDLPPTSTILLFHFPPLHPGFTSAMGQNFYKRSRWSRGFQLNGENVSAQFSWIALQDVSHTGTIPLQLAPSMESSLSLMQLQATR